MYNYYKGIVAYDGTNYKGWQMQKEGIPTVQRTMEKAVSKVFDAERIPVNGASRTDSGVHARGQAFQFRCMKSMDPYNILRGCNSFLPPDIRIMSLEESNRDFHPIFSATGKEYVYRFIHPDDPLANRYAYILQKMPDTERMERALALFKGEKDYSAFRNLPGKAPEKDPVCHIKEIFISRHAGGFNITVIGNRFLYNMIRIMMGTLLYLGYGATDEEHIIKAFETGDREYTGKTLAAQGLTLEKVFYDSL